MLGPLHRAERQFFRLLKLLRRAIQTQSPLTGGDDQVIRFREIHAVAGVIGPQRVVQHGLGLTGNHRRPVEYDQSGGTGETGRQPLAVG